MNRFYLKASTESSKDTTEFFYYAYGETYLVLPKIK